MPIPTPLTCTPALPCGSQAGELCPPVPGASSELECLLESSADLEVKTPSCENPPPPWVSCSDGSFPTLSKTGRLICSLNVSRSGSQLLDLAGPFSAGSQGP